jgi:hypothetical protein
MQSPRGPKNALVRAQGLWKLEDNRSGDFPRDCPGRGLRRARTCGPDGIDA